MKNENRRHKIAIIEHAHYESALNLAYTHAHRAAPGTLVLIVGMSGAGKNTLAKEIQAQLLIQHDPGVSSAKPVINLVAATSENSFYSSKDATSRLVDLLEEPFHSTKRDKLLKPYGLNLTARSHRSTPETTLRTTAIRQLDAKKTAFLFVDEADMMCVIKKSGRDPADHLDSWRLLALESNTVLILLATYRILRIWDRTSQFTRKMPLVHMQRYRVEIDDDVTEFVALVSDLCRRFGVDREETVLILERAPALMYATGGIFGQLLALFERADDRAEAEGRSAPGLEDIRRALPTARQIRTLWEEIAIGERRLEKVDFDDVRAVTQAAVASVLTQMDNAGQSNNGTFSDPAVAGAPRAPPAPATIKPKHSGDNGPKSGRKGKRREKAKRRPVGA